MITVNSTTYFEILQQLNKISYMSLGSFTSCLQTFFSYNISYFIEPNPIYTQLMIRQRA